ncbi:MAG: small ribosomal subunit Rsm22 family protein [Verrucomicrobiota bacterium]
MIYPEALEQWWEAEALSRMKHPKRKTCLHKLVIAADILSDLFTSEREEDFSGYTQDEEAVLAYGCYFYPQTFTRVRYAMRELLQFRQWRPPVEDQSQSEVGVPAGPRMRVLDLGCGLGAASMGAVTEMAHQGVTQGMLIDAVDQSNLQLELLRKLSMDQGNLWPQARWMTHRGNMKTALQQSVLAQAEGWDMIILSFSLGEAFFGSDDEQVLNWLKKLSMKLKPGGLLLVLEPALAETSLRLQRVRDLWLKQESKPSILGPCLHAQACPMLQRHGTKHWCHEVHSWHVPALTEEINRKFDAPRHLHELKFSFLALTNDSKLYPEGGDALFRMTSPVVETSGKLQMSGCAASGRLNDYDLLTRSFKAKDKKEAKRRARGDIIHSPADKIIRLKGEHQFRLQAKEAFAATYQPH